MEQKDITMQMVTLTTNTLLEVKKEILLTLIAKNYITNKAKWVQLVQKERKTILKGLWIEKITLRKIQICVF